MMPDAQLQKYAAMHKNDPYIFPMAFAESNMRKEARAAQQAQAMGQQQPKVVDQDLMEMGQPPMPPQGMPPQGMPPQGMPPQGMPPQGMPPQGGPQDMPPQGGPQMAQQQLPENQGIGALPAPNMQRMADGGIAGYGDDDGGEFNYSGGSDGPLINMAGGGIAHFDSGGLAKKYAAENQEMVSGNRVQYSPDVAAYADQLSNAKSAAYQAEDRAYADRERARMLQGPNGMPFKATEFDPGRGDSWDNEPVSAFDPGRGDSWDNEPTSKKKETDKKKSGAKNTEKKPAANANVIPPEETKAAAPAEKAPTGEDLIAQALKGSKTLNEEAAAAYKPYHDQLNKENEEIAGRKADNRGYALFAAGLKMMGTKSPYAAQGISEGGLEGLRVYQEAEKADAAARKANQQSQMLLMQAERAERSGNMKVAGDMQSRAEQARQFGITAEQHAETLKETKAYHQGMLANDKIKANAAMLSAQNRGGGLYGAEDKHMVALAKVQSVLNSNPVYKEAAKNATMPGNIGATARATVAQIERDTYNRFAPELLQSGQGSPTGSGSGQKVLDFNSIK
jgi:hypothetical protein